MKSKPRFGASLRGGLVALACLLAGMRGAQAFTYPTDAPTFVDVQDTAYAIPGGAYFASPTGLDVNAGTLASPWSLSKAIASVPTGGILVLRGGDYRGVPNLSVRRRMTIQAYPHEKPMLRGDLLVTAWASAGSNRWSTDTTPGSGVTFEYPRPTNFDANYTNSTNPLAGDREIVFLEGKPLVQVGTLAEVDALSFYVDRANDKLYIGQDPAGKTVEITASSRGLTVFRTGTDLVDGAIVRGLGFMRFADSGLQISGTGVVVEKCTSSWNGIQGIDVNGRSRLSLDMVVRDNIVTCNGLRGLNSSQCDRLIIEGNTFSYNNVEKFVGSWAAAGFKVTQMRDLTIRNNFLEGNYATAIWMDISVINAKVYRNFVRNNQSIGIFFEICHGAIIAENVVVNCGSGIMLSGSSDARVYNNTLVRNSTNITVKDAGRVNDPTVDNGVSGGGGLPDGDPFEGGENADDAALGADWRSRNNILKNNLLSNSKGNYLIDAAGTARNEATTLMIAAMDFNAYYRASSGTPTNVLRWRSSSASYQDFKTVNGTTSSAFRFVYPAFETKGVAIDGGSNPFFVNETGGDYRLKAGSPASGKGEKLPDDISDLLNRPRGAVTSIGAFESAALPASPTSLTATAQSADRIDLSWTDDSSGEGGFGIERSLDGVSFDEIGTVGPNVTTYQDEPLASGTLYTYRVRAFDVLGAAASPSNLASATTLTARQISPLADAYVQDNTLGTESSTNFGAATNLLVKTNSAGAGYNRDAYLKFDLPTSGGVESAKLRFWATVSDGATVTTRLYGVSDTAWIETGAGGITWNNKPALNTPNSLSNPFGSLSMTGGTLTMYEIDVTRFLQLEKAAGRNTITLAFHNTTATTAIISINSKEAASNGPVLVINPLARANQSPVAVSDTYSLLEDVTLSVAAPGVLINDSDADGAAQGTTLSATLVTAPLDGFLKLQPDGSFTYTRRANSSGSDFFTYTATDGLGVSNTVSVTLNTTAVNDPPTIDLNGVTISGLRDYNTSFVAGRAPVAATHSTAAVGDDGGNLVSLSATITNLKNGSNEVLAANTSGTSLLQSYNATTGTLTISGTATTATYQTVLRSITYGNSAAAPDMTDRLISFAVNDGELSNNESAVTTVEMRAANLPSPWQNEDVAYTGTGGNLGLAGNTTFTAPDTFTVQGSGAGIEGVNDAFQFVYQSLSGDGQIVARLASMQGTGAAAKAGVMMRETLSISARNAFIGLTPSNGGVFQARTGNGSTTTVTPLSGVTAPRWFKLVRIGNAVTGYLSTDGISWTLADTDSVPMTSAIYVGFGVTSDDKTKLATAVFDNVAVSTVEAAPTPVITPNGGNFNDSVTVSLSSLPNSQIYYTLDGSTPDNTDTLYTAPFSLTSTKVVKAISYRESFSPSAVASATFTANALATLSVGSAQVLEGSSGTTSLVFPLTLSRAVAFDVSATYNTGGGTATAGSDYTAATGATVSIPAGQLTGSIAVPVLGDMRVEANETFTLTLSAPVNATLGTATATGTILNDDSAVAGTSGAIISEFRFRGPGGGADEFVEIFNTLTTPLNVSGWSIRYQTAAGVQTSPIDAGIVIPARGHFLFAGTAYSLSSYTAGDMTLTGDALDASGVALYNGQATPVLQDAVGFAASASSLREGAGLASAPTASSEHAWVREYLGVFPKNTVADSSQDFVLVATSGAAMAGSNGSLTPQLGAPSPEGLASPVFVNDQITTLMLDPNVPQSSAPNRVRLGTGDSGTLRIRRTLVNKTGRTLNRVRFHAILITSQNSPLINGNTAATQADVRLVSSADEPAVAVTGGTVPVYGTKLEAPSTEGAGALGSTMSFEAMLSTPLAPNASRSYSFLLNVVKSGNFSAYFNIEALPTP